MKCFTDTCQNNLGPESLVIEHRGEVTSFLCETCLGVAKGLKLMLKKNDEGTFVIDEATPIDKPF